MRQPRLRIRMPILQRRGFTLVEILASVVLSAMLVAAAFGAMHLQWTLRSAGEAQVEHSQVVRGIFDDITCDVRSARRPGSFDDKIVSTANANSLLQKPTTIRTTDFAEQLLNVPQRIPQTPVSFLGESNFLVIELSQANERFHPREQSANSSRSESHQVVWFCHSGESLRLPLVREEQRLIPRSLEAADWPHGLTRIEISASDDVPSFATSSLTPKHGTWFAVANEIRSLQFRYFDGREWHGAWDSQTLGRLPTAIEVTCELLSVESSQTFVLRLPQGG